MEKVNTRIKMVMAALDLFHRQGVNATSVDQILQKSGTGKSQFSHYFKNKEGLVHASLLYLHELIQNGQVSTGYTIDTWKQLDGWFDSYIEYQKSVECERSCPVGTIGADILNEQPQLRQDVLNFLAWSREQLAAFFYERKERGELVSHVDPFALADLCISVMQGGMLLSKMKRDTDMFENASNQVLTYIKSLRTHRVGDD